MPQGSPGGKVMCGCGGRVLRACAALFPRTPLDATAAPEGRRVVLLVLLPLLVFLPNLWAGMVWDDQWLLKENSRLDGPLLELLRSDFRTLAEVLGSRAA
jgi:hypothetical protein